MKVDQTIDDVQKLIDDFDYILKNLNSVRTVMVRQKLESIGIDVSTAEGHILYLRNWSNKTANTADQEEVKAKADSMHRFWVGLVHFWCTSNNRPEPLILAGLAAVEMVGPGPRET